MSSDVAHAKSLQSEFMKIKSKITPISFPVILFFVIIMIGAFILYCPISNTTNISFIDALFTATSATCVTGLSVVDTGKDFSFFGQLVILLMIQLGGLGIMTYTSIISYMLYHKVSLKERMVLSEIFSTNASFNFGKFLILIVTYSLFIELIGAMLLYVQRPTDFTIYSSIFHSISAFCNAGFSLYSDNLMKFRSDWGINMVFIVLIWSGGIGFSVILELKNYIIKKLKQKIFGKQNTKPIQLGWHSGIVVKTSLYLILGGWLSIYLAEFVGTETVTSTNDAILSSLFQSVTCRTAGFNTVDIGKMTNLAILIMIFLMFIGGASGSCAGGIKIETFRVLLSFVYAHIKGRTQSVLGKFAVDLSTLNKSILLLIGSLIVIIAAVFILNLTECRNIPSQQAKELHLEILFETISAFGTVGLSMGITPKLTSFGKFIIVLMMFIGRLGPILIINAIQSYQHKISYEYPEESLPIG